MHPGEEWFIVGLPALLGHHRGVHRPAEALLCALGRIETSLRSGCPMTSTSTSPGTGPSSPAARAAHDPKMMTPRVF